MNQAKQAGIRDPSHDPVAGLLAVLFVVAVHDGEILLLFLSASLCISLSPSVSREKANQVIPIYTKVVLPNKVSKGWGVIAGEGKGEK